MTPIQMALTALSHTPGLQMLSPSEFFHVLNLCDPDIFSFIVVFGVHTWSTIRRILTMYTNFRVALSMDGMLLQRR